MKLLTAKEVGKALRVDPATVRRWCKCNCIEHVKLPGKKVRISEETLTKMLSGGNAIM